MDTFTLNRILFNNPVTKKYYRGCFCADGIPERLGEQWPKAIVVNLDRCGNEGSHWVAIFMTPAYSFYFDSYGYPPEEPISKYLRKINKRIVYNNRGYQSMISDVCGHYCIMVLYFACLGLDYTRILRMLDSVKNPDDYVRSFVQTITHI